jgi:hopanoid biosynthesis associated protein HpnK
VSAAVIINADDFGLTPGVNRGVLSAFREGVLTSTTMLVNLRFFDDAVALARDNPDLPVGIHLSLLWGRPVADPAHVPSLVGPDGAFPRSLATLVRRYVFGRLRQDEVRCEFRAQVRKFLDAGLRPTHLDTHKHVHALPGILRALLAVGAEFGIRKLRLPYENGVGRGRPSPLLAAQRSLVRALCRGSRTVLSREGFKTTDHFLGIGHMERLDAPVLGRILEGLPSGVTELMCHPGYVDEHLGEFARVPPHRERELAGLKDPTVRALVATRGVRLMHYGEL